MLNATQRFISELGLRGHSENTIKSYAYVIDEFLSFLPQKGENPENITEDDVKAYLFHSKNEKKNVSRTIQKKLNAINTFLSLTGSKLEVSIKLPRAPAKLPEFLTIEETKTLLSSTQDPREKAMLRLLYATGLRVSELVNLDRNRIEGDTVKVVHGKGAKDRIVCVDEGTLVVLGKYLETRKDSNPAVFLNKAGNRVSSRLVQRIVEKLAGKAGIRKHVSPHTLRHSFATHLLQNDADIVVIKDLLGHSSLQTTQIYTHLTDAYKEKVYMKSHPLARQDKSESKEEKP